jgi:hypothetical protein
MGTGVLKISGNQMAAFVADAEDKRRADFHARWTAQAAVLGTIDRPTLDAAIDRYEAEAELDGVDTDDRLFCYIAAFRLMPDMGGHQFIEMMDVVFLDPEKVDDAEKLRRLVHIAQTVPGDG